ncbi:hypothetical protein P4N68_07975 [Corynebacterium felinum]|uniref:Uncharacterized protein n=1 Tax=Corynebacterium felinum TaxID=131318 RepID=A0ABU2BC62_9CORY|nr:hypothetical protein [Corynebacterium felinum]MDF5821016.1 hypothetical protein [Corynebacterium felinum]MDR7356221.1 hypothetical protein [Corynebacterium felinum]WJY95553.1 hypothetical protein CFELI_09755 [Corynebacterium felinum]
MSTGFTALITTYVISQWENLETVQQRYFQRVDAVAKTAKVVWVSENITREEDQPLLDQLFRELSEAVSSEETAHLLESDWHLLSFATLVETETVLTTPGECPESLLNQLRLEREGEQPRLFLSRTRAQVLSATGSALPLGKVFS